jgi:hypothetical protein
MIGVTKFRTSRVFNLKHGAHIRRGTTSEIATPDHAVPYGTVLSEDVFPGTSCQARHEQATARRMATIMLSLRDKIILCAEIDYVSGL